MKFLRTHKTTIQKLKEWAGNRDLLFARFFSWRPGAEAEKALDGLLSGLLHDTLKQFPEFIPAVFPEQWDESIAGDWRFRLQFRFSRENIRVVFHHLLHNKELFVKYRMCFFIDGLDECLVSKL
jgi:hypothetical protein